MIQRNVSALRQHVVSQFEVNIARLRKGKKYLHVHSKIGIVMMMGCTFVSNSLGSTNLFVVGPDQQEFNIHVCMPYL